MILLIKVKGAVQGVGYRPFIAQKATEYGLKGYVKNIGAAVEILAAGDEEKLKAFSDLLKKEYPAGAFILDVEITELHDDVNYDDFEIISSTDIDLSSELPVFLPDIGICDDCLSEMLDPKDVRYRYPLISCATCGPRISIADALPYDRENTAMKPFSMCPVCKRDYKEGRRRHAQTVSCFECGPQLVLEYFDTDGEKNFVGKEASVEVAIDLLRNGKILGLKGVSGYQLVCVPQNETTAKLREIKGRESKPFAIMFSDAKAVKDFCKVGSFEEELLNSSARPIVLLDKIKDFPYEVCRDSDYIGAFLPSAGIHRLLCDALGPLIVTSANRSGEPMIIDDGEFDTVFFDLVDGVLRHERRINMAQDDSVVFVHDKKPLFLRRARGYVPLPLVLLNGAEHDKTVLSLGGDLKSTFSFGKKDRVITSQYIGDLEDLGCLTNFKDYIDRYMRLYHIKPDMIVCDLHPGYHSAKYGQNLSEDMNIPIFKVQHHHAHVLSVMAEHSLGSCIGVALDGTGYGTDGKIWGGEFLLCDGAEYTRAGHLSYVKLCGGDKASVNAELVKSCYEYGFDRNGDAKIDPVVKAALLNNINTFETSSTGRLFDAVCALLDIKKQNSYEGECAILLENAARRGADLNKPSLSFKIDDTGETIIADQISLFADIRSAYESGEYQKEAVAYAFHEALSEVIAKICHIIRERHGENNVCLSGGVFANRILLTKTVDALKQDNFEVYINEFVPAGDAGISLGQAYYGLLSQKEV
ncbi:MAG: carbamoyltransferase HypF [Butyrivibrio sp.]|nr:carbamoyltransferase HypF [Butyrivibrio sp.]